MIGVVIVTHGKLAGEFRAALEHVVGPQEQVETISIGPDDDLDARRADMLAALGKVDSDLESDAGIAGCGRLEHAA